MAHFAKLDENNIVINVVVIADSDAPTESEGEAFCKKLFKVTNTFKQTSYNTHQGVHSLGGTPFRKNFAGKGFTYDSTRDAFIPPKPYNSWTLNEDTCHWDAPVAYPSEGYHSWDEENRQWVEITEDTL